MKEAIVTIVIGLVLVVVLFMAHMSFTHQVQVMNEEEAAVRAVLMSKFTASEQAWAEAASVGIWKGHCGAYRVLYAASKAWERGEEMSDRGCGDEHYDNMLGFAYHKQWQRTLNMHLMREYLISELAAAGIAAE